MPGATTGHHTPDVLVEGGRLLRDAEAILVAVGMSTDSSPPGSRGATWDKIDIARHDLTDRDLAHPRS